MMWFIRLGCLCFLVALVGACDGGGDIGKPCKLTQEQNRANLKLLDRKARIVEASAACELTSFCFANYYDAQQEGKGLGYCSKICKPDVANDCPTGFTCEVFISAKLPKDLAEVLGPIAGKPICVKTPPQATQP